MVRTILLGVLVLLSGCAQAVVGQSVPAGSGPSVGAVDSVEDCRDGVCTLTVTGPVSVPLDAATGMRLFEVVALDDGHLSYRAESAGGDQAATGRVSQGCAITVDDRRSTAVCGRPVEPGHGQTVVVTSARADSAVLNLFR